MYRTLNDLRLLRLALHLENTLEAYEEYLRDFVPTAPVRARLAELFQAGPAHKRLEAAARELAGATFVARPSVDDVLQTILDCERVAHDFYVRSLDGLSDAGLVQLFRDLAEEEARHMGIVRRAMRAATPSAGATIGTESHA